VQDAAPRRRLDLYWISLVFFFAFLGPAALQLFLPDFYAAGGADSATARANRSWILVCLYTSFLFWRVFITPLIGRLGHKRTIVCGAVTYLLFAVALTVSRSLAVHLGAAALMGWGAACIWIAGTAQILHTTPPERYGFAAGFRRSAVMIGYVIGYPLLAACLAADPSGPTAGLVAIGSGVLAVTAALLIPRREVRVAPFSLGRFLRLARRREILVVGFFLLGSAVSYGLVLSFLRDFVGRQGGSALFVGLTMVAFPVAQGLCALAGGAAMDFFGKARVLQVGFAIAGVGLVVAALLLRNLTGVAVLWLAVPTLLLGLQNSLVPVGADALAGDVVDAPHREAAIGAMYVWRDVGILLPLLAHLLIGELAGTVDYGLVFGGFAGYFFLCALLAGMAAGWLQRRPKTP